MKKLTMTMAGILTLAAMLPITASAKTTLGDVNMDGKINAVDASLILEEYANYSSGQISKLNSTQLYLADVNKDKKIDAVDASKVLEIYAHNATHTITQPETQVSFFAYGKYGHDSECFGEFDTYEEAFSAMLDGEQELQSQSFYCDKLYITMMQTSNEEKMINMTIDYVYVSLK